MKRYDLEYGTGYTEHRDMIERPEGEWVRFEDAQAATDAAVKAAFAEAAKTAQDCGLADDIDLHRIADAIRAQGWFKGL